MSNGQQGSMLVGADGRPVNQSIFMLGPFAIQGAANPEAIQQLYQEAFLAIDPVTGMVSPNPEKGVQITWISTCIALQYRDETISYLESRIDELEKAMRKAVPGYQPPLPPGAKTEADVATIHMGTGSAVRVWPDGAGNYPDIKVPVKALFKMGTLEVEVKEGDLVQRRDDGVYINEERAVPKQDEATET